MDRIIALRGRSPKAAAPHGRKAIRRKQIADFDGKVDGVRKQIVATTEGGAITGEERLREHTDQLYGAILSYEGKPAASLLTYIDTLKRELDEVTKEFDQLLAKDLPGLNDSLKAKGQQPLSSPPAKVEANGSVGQRDWHDSRDGLASSGLAHLVLARARVFFFYPTRGVFFHIRKHYE